MNNGRVNFLVEFGTKQALIPDFTLKKAQLICILYGCYAVGSSVLRRYTVIFPRKEVRSKNVRGVAIISPGLVDGFPSMMR